MNKFLLTSLAIGVQFALAHEFERNAMFTWYEGIDPKNVLYAISCGSDEPITDVTGIVYQADKGFSDGKVSHDGHAKKKWVVPNTEVYLSERWHDDDFNYKIPIDLS